MEHVNLIDYHRTRDFSAKMSVTFEFIRQNFASLSKSILFIAGPPIVLASLFVGSFISDMFTVFFNVGRYNDPTIMAEAFSTTNFWVQLLLMMVASLAALISAIATINSYIILYEEKKTTRISTSDVWTKVRSDVWMYAGTTVLLYVLLYVAMFAVGILLGLVTAAAPMLSPLAVLVLFGGVLYVAISTCLIYIVRAYERRGFFDAIGRSFSLVTGKWWSTFGLYVVLAIIAGIISYIFLIPGYVITLVASLHNIEGGSPADAAGQVPATAMLFFSLYYAAVIMLQTLTQVGLAFQYFNLVERKEAKGLLGKIDTLGEEASAPRQDEHY